MSFKRNVFEIEVFCQHNNVSVETGTSKAIPEKDVQPMNTLRAQLSFEINLYILSFKSSVNPAQQAQNYSVYR